MKPPEIEPLVEWWLVFVGTLIHIRWAANFINEIRSPTGHCWLKLRRHAWEPHRTTMRRCRVCYWSGVDVKRLNDV